MIAAWRSLASTPWSDPRARLLDVVELASSLEAASMRTALLELSAARSDTAPALWLTESVLVGGRAVRALVDDIRDNSWCDRLALEIAPAGTIGVVSLGRSTRSVLGALAALRAEMPVVRTGTGAIARGLDDLGVITEPADPADTDLCLIPAAAIAAKRIWTSESAVRAIGRGRARMLVVADPVIELGPWAVERYRPLQWLVPVERPG